MFGHRLDSMISGLFWPKWFCKTLAKTWHTCSSWWYKQLNTPVCGVQGETKYCETELKKEYFSPSYKDGKWTNKSSRVLCQLTWWWHTAHQQIGLLGDQQGRELAKQELLVQLLTHICGPTWLLSESSQNWAWLQIALRWVWKRDRRGAPMRSKNAEREGGILKGPPGYIHAITLIWSDTGKHFHSRIQLYPDTTHPWGRKTENCRIHSGTAI